MIALLLAIVMTIINLVLGHFYASKEKTDVSYEVSFISYLCAVIMSLTLLTYFETKNDTNEIKDMLKDMIKLQELQSETPSSFLKQSSSSCTSSHKEDTQKRDTIAFPLPFQSK